MSFTEAFIAPHPYLFTFLCTVLIIAIYNMVVVSKNNTLPCNDGTSDNIETNDSTYSSTEYYR